MLRENALFSMRILLFKRERIRLFNFYSIWKIAVWLAMEDKIILLF